MVRIDFPLVDRPASYSTSNTIEHLSIPIERRPKLFKFGSMSAIYIGTHKTSGLGMVSIFKTSSENALRQGRRKCRIRIQAVPAAIRADWVWAWLLQASSLARQSGRQSTKVDAL
jgi:hypothetical protein